MLKPCGYLFFPIKDGRFLRDSQGKPRFYNSAEKAVKELERFDYDFMKIYEEHDMVSRRELESFLHKVKHEITLESESND